MSEEKEEKQPQEMPSESSFFSDERLKQIRDDPNQSMRTRIIAGAILKVRYKPEKIPKVSPGKENLS
jgi:hypothetical protein